MAAERITSAASSTSNNERLEPPVILIIALRAPTIEVSNKGLETACLAASIALFSPEPRPIPI